jgi:divalent metal cation (Fe/Co/Zn/Cd) transporter
MVVHLLVPGDWSVRKGHKLAEQFETRVLETIKNTNIVTHIEPIDDPLSMEDASVERGINGQ